MVLAARAGVVLFVAPTEVGVGVNLALGSGLSSTANLILLPIGADASLINLLSGVCVLLPERPGVIVLLVGVLLVGVLAADVLLAALTAVAVLILAVVG